MQDGVWHAVCATADIETGTMMPVEIGDLQIAIYNVGGEFFATDNICSHAFALLTDGLLEDDMVECPLHGACFDVKTGKAQCEPAEIDLRVYPTRLTGELVEVCVAD
ncbi:non-heme iron oxygenase ferredoxin subunit [Bradyrhizobium sp. KBS0727]|jgi:nitrite reductase/ring-hydroxylating ferredoxin subunit|uniref:non-heme iron oxygenase ferredoxin subunit n=1 Tax=unclassified Bradyrhizobium TaxID=2631580 RepID=UPI00110DABC1|nr:MULTISPECIES: non-heme iron oxygenase ferredoxin subunit [unclassified Bradyrhizobium]QDW36136.1 non-heme iron oxygenase ferredoxin subunit [Bradyrhizobium sp. KBS0725]QDW42737.1 non-heme iron oxygenase ferredoxin subunit [Bradyrhizobium sp. KBS0727]